MKVRVLKITDAELMLEWMHDAELVKYLNGRFQEKGIEDCIKFIKETNVSYSNNLHFAIVDNDDEYMGTVSLKNIDRYSKTAEFAIAMRRHALGKGFASYGMKYILDYGKKEYELKNIYWCVNKNNERAIKFYDKNNYCRISAVPSRIKDIYEKDKCCLLWYCY